MLSDARDFRVGTGRCTVSWRVVCALSRAPTAGGLVRLVLRVLDWYTSCSSLNLPSAEYAGDTVRECESGNPSLAGSYESVISLIDAGQRSGYAESNACLRGHHLSHQQIRVKLRLCVFECVAVSQEPERSPPNLQRLRKAGGGLPSSPH